MLIQNFKYNHAFELLSCADLETAAQLPMWPMRAVGAPSTPFLKELTDLSLFRCFIVRGITISCASVSCLAFIDKLFASTWRLVLDRLLVSFFSPGSPAIVTTSFILFRCIWSCLTRTCADSMDDKSFVLFLSAANGSAREWSRFYESS